ncbi:uncharacterized protein LOC143470509 [Clavelina lepadiformis]|uniref:uncharacterized protein LOC143470509 n=1 Tax=Clavelina lepadiformis TaxID=159417 RepID=UPI0040415A90
MTLDSWRTSFLKETPRHLTKRKIDKENCVSTVSSYRVNKYTKRNPALLPPISSFQLVRYKERWLQSSTAVVTLKLSGMEIFVVRQLTTVTACLPSPTLHH